MNQLNHSLILAQDLGDDDGGGSSFPMIIALVLTVVVIAGLWKTFTKAGKPGWGAFIPIYNLILLLEIAGRPIWWIILLFIPIVNLIVAIMIFGDVARKFGKGSGFGLGLTFLGFIFFPILGFGSAEYQPTSSAAD